MSNSEPIVNPAHGSGYTCIAFSSDGLLAYTGGADSIVRIWNTQQGADQDPPIAIDATEPVTSISVANSYWLSGSEDGEVRRYMKGSSDLDGLVVSAAGVPIRCVAADPEGKRVAVASDELFVKVISVEDTTKVTVLTGFTKAVRNITWHPSGSYLTTSGGDGNVNVWDLSEDEPKQVEAIKNLIPAIHDTQDPNYVHDSSAIWHPSGEYFVVATRTHDIAAVSRSTWAKSFSFFDDAQSGAITALGFCSNGAYLASASKAGVFIWSTQTHRVLFRMPTGSADVPISHLAWSPRHNILAWTDMEGSLTRHNNVIPSSFASPIKVSASTTARSVTMRQRAAPTLFDDDEVANDKETSGDADLDIASGDAAVDTLADFLDDDLGEYLKDDEEAEAKFRSGRVEVVNITKAQPTFQPGSTPVEAGKRKRLLAYNMLGYIEITDQDTHHVVDIKMHDQSPSAARKGYNFTDTTKYDMASLGERGIAFACAPEAGHPAHISFRPYASWETGTRAAEDEWVYELAPGVRILGLAAGGAAVPSGSGSRRKMTEDTQGRGHVVVATSENELTFLTGTGIERYSMGLDGDFVSMVAGPEWVFVVHRDGATTIDGSQNLKGTIITLDDYCILQERRLPIPKNHVLKWIGVTDEGAPAIYDSTGVLSIMPRFRLPMRATWARVLNTNMLTQRERKDELYWPFAVTGETFRCIVLKGRQEHPPFPVPYPQEFPLRLPFRKKPDDDEAALEEKYARDALFLDIHRDALGDELTTPEIARAEAALDTQLIKMIQKACSNTSARPTRPQRAIDLTRMLHHAAFVDKAIQIAQFYKLRGLEDRMRSIRADKDDEQRLLDARERRQERISDLGIIPPPAQPRTGGATGNSSRPRPFEDFNPPPTIHRPGLVRANPSVQNSTLGSKDETNGGGSFDSESWATQEGKRKRAEDDDVEPVTEDIGAKRRALQDVVGTSKPKNNPFARKAVNDNVRNPFGRSTEKGKELQKSESFFNRVEEAETSNSKVTTKPKQVAKQSTLFGLPPRDPGKTLPKKKTDPALQKSTLVEETIDSTDVSMDPVDDDQGKQIEVESQEKTQVLDEGDDEQTQTSIASIGVDDTETPEPIEWPASP